MGNAAVPLPKNMPPDLAWLAGRNAVEVRAGARFQGDVDRLIGGIVELSELAQQTPGEPTDAVAASRRSVESHGSGVLASLPAPSDVSIRSLSVWCAATFQLRDIALVARGAVVGKPLTDTPRARSSQAFMERLRCVGYTMIKQRSSVEVPCQTHSNPLRRLLLS